MSGANVFDRWVDNEESVGDFLWAANEPSGGTFQVKVKLLTAFSSKDMIDPNLQCVSQELPHAGG